MPNKSETAPIGPACSGRACSRPRRARPSARQMLESFSPTAEPEEPGARTGLGERNEIVLELAAARLRRFAFGARPGGRRPILVCAPYALHDARLVDLCEGHSLMAALRAAARRSILVEWLSAQASQAFRGIDDYLADLNVMVDEIGGLCDFIGLCQGGWLSLIYAARFPDKAGRLVLAAAADRSRRRRVGGFRRWRDRRRTRFFTNWSGSAKGWRAAIRPSVSGASRWKARRRSTPCCKAACRPIRRASRPRRRCSAPGPNDAQPAGRPITLKWSEKFYKQNQLAKGEFVALWTADRAEAMRRPLYLIAALDDEVAAPEQTLACARSVGTPRAALRERNGAVAAISSPFVGAKSLEEVWPEVLDLGWRPHSEQAAIAARRDMRRMVQVDDSRDKCAKMALCPFKSFAGNLRDRNHPAGARSRAAACPHCAKPEFLCVCDAIEPLANESRAVDPATSAGAGPATWHGKARPSGTQKFGAENRPVLAEPGQGAGARGRRRGMGRPASRRRRGRRPAARPRRRRARQEGRALARPGPRAEGHQGRGDFRRLLGAGQDACGGATPGCSRASGWRSIRKVRRFTASCGASRGARRSRPSRRRRWRFRGSRTSPRSRRVCGRVLPSCSTNIAPRWRPVWSRPTSRSRRRAEKGSPPAQPRRKISAGERVISWRGFFRPAA